MENEISFDGNTKKLIKAFRSKVCKGQQANRKVLLAYAFLRNRPYIWLETKINEDRESFGIGRDTFLYNLAYNVYWEISIVNKSEKITDSLTLTKADVYNWIMAKYNKVEEKIEERAA